MLLKERMMSILDDMDKAAGLFESTGFEIYFLGGAACILGEYLDRATRDFDFIDLDYNAKMGRVFALLRDFDMLEYESTLLAPDYKFRAKKLSEIQNFDAFILAPEDIVVSKIIRLSEKDSEDIEKLIPLCDKDLIREIIKKVMNREDLFPAKKDAFLKNLPVFKERYHV